MVIYFGADHGGFELKGRLMAFVKGMGYETADMGDTAPNPDDDYPDFAAKVAEKVSADPANARGILICRSGAGVDIVANKFKGVRSALATTPDQAYDGRHDDDANVLSLAADFTSPEDAERIVKVFLGTPFGGDARFERRLGKIKEIEEHG